MKATTSNTFVKIISIGIVGGLVCSCGVKGDPRPPATPAELGRGQPTYKKATEEFAFPDVPPVEEDPDKKEETGF